MKDYALIGAKVCTETDILQEGVVVVRAGMIDQVYARGDDFPKPLPTDIEHITLSADDVIIPGFIDVHIHGANGSDVMDADQDALSNVAATIFKQGTTSFLATTMTASDEDIHKVVRNVKQFTEYQASHALDQATVSGIHLEGPYLSERKIGAQNRNFIQTPNIAQFEQWQKSAGDLIRKVTLAPEESGALALTRHLKDHNIVASIGHTNCTAKRAQQAIKAGASSCTHFFNAMSGVHHRTPGAATAILMSNDIRAELIADGVHLAPEILQLALEVKGADQLLLVTDAMSAQSFGDGIFDLGGQKVIVKGNEARMENGVLAGSVLTMNQALIHMMNATDCSLIDAVKMASTTPAKELDLAHEIGSISIGKKADLVVLDARYQVKKTFKS
jgi:N-acetylglucosamine-6-phosphate deacetylase